MRPLLIAAALACTLVLPSSADEVRLLLLHTTDLHGALTAWDYAEDRPAARGLVKLATLVAAARAEGPPVLLLDAGDCIQGGGLETVYQRGERARPDPMMLAMTRMGYDAMALGNHEFDRGLAALDKARTAAGFPWLAANVVDARTGRPAFGASLVKTIGLLRVGVIGITTPAVPAMLDSALVAGLRFDPPVEAARAEARRLRGRERCDLVVVLAHTGLERSRARGESTWRERPGVSAAENWGYRLATQVPESDVLLLGHTHVVIPWDTLGGTLVSQAGKSGEQLGRIEVAFTRDKPGDRFRVASKRGRMIAVTDSTPSAAELVELAKPYHDAARAELGKVIGRTKRRLDAPRGWYGDGAAWDLIHRAQLQASGADVSLASLADPGVDIGPGPVTERDLLRLYPFDNTLGVVELSGAELRQVLERSAETLATYTFEGEHPLGAEGVPSWQFDSAEGVTYAIDLTKPPGRRIVQLEFAGKPLAPERRLRVAVNGYRLSGGGGFETIRKAPRTWETSREVRDLMRESIAKAGALDLEPSDNWTLLPDYAASFERPLIDRLVRLGAMPRDEAMRARPDAPAERGDLASWLARAFGWRARRASKAFDDVPDSLAPFVDALLERRVLGRGSEADRFDPHGPVSVSLALDWCERAARSVSYALMAKTDHAFRAGLLAGIDGGRASTMKRDDPLTRAQLLGIVANVRYPTIRVLETTDFHGAILGGARRSGRPVGGSAVLAAHLARLRAENPHGTVLVDGGDCFQGTMISNLQFGRPVVEQMNALGYTAAAIGNHEFDWSVDTLARRVREERFAALGANMREKKTGRMPKWARSDTSVVRRGVRIGILGLCYRNTPSVTLARHVAHLRFEDDSVTSVRLVPKLRRTNDVVIGIGHVPAESDSARHALRGDLVRLARGVPGVDAWFGGHSHNQVVDEIAGKPVLISGSHGEFVGVCDLVVDPIANRVIESSARLVPTFADEVTPDSAMLARVARWNLRVAPLASVVLGTNARRLVRERNGESAVGDLVTDAIRAASGAHVVFQNSGGLRADLPEGVLTKGAIYEVMPFDNQIVTMDLTGAEVKRAIEQGLNVGRVPQVSGIRYTFDPSRPPDERVVALTDSDGRPLEPWATYRVATNDFMATGGDDYDVLATGRNRTETGMLVRDVLEAYVADRSRDGGALDVRLDGRIQRVGTPPR